jgi:hypothetical protein
LVKKEVIRSRKKQSDEESQMGNFCAKGSVLEKMIKEE